jgi:hypothetical protein
MMDYVDIFGMIDPPYELNRSVWYWAEFRGQRSERTEDHARALAWARAIAAEHGTHVCDCSDCGSGYLRSVLARG